MSISVAPADCRGERLFNHLVDGRSFWIVVAAKDVTDDTEPGTFETIAGRRAESV